MKKLGYVIAALGAIVIAAPSIASAETLVVGHGARAEMHRNHGWHRGHGMRDHGWHRGYGMRHHDRMTVFRHRHHEG